MIQKSITNYISYLPLFCNKKGISQREIFLKKKKPQSFHKVMIYHTLDKRVNTSASARGSSQFK